jgi:hypothetical protein
MSLYTIGWLAWIGWFLLEEGLALFGHGRGNTLSEHVWRWFGIPETGHDQPAVHQPITGWVRARRFALLAFLAWLALHFLTGGRF